MTTPSSSSRRPFRRLLPLLLLLLGLPRVDPLRAAEPAPSSWDVARAGAATDGGADATANFQQQLDAAGRAGGGVVAVPAGRYRIDGTLRIPAHVTLQGVFRVPPTPGPLELDQLPGSVLLARAGRNNSQGSPFVQTVRLPATGSDRQRVELRCAGWTPSRTIPASGDGRTLGLQVYAVTVTVTAGTGEPATDPSTPAKAFDANTRQ